MCKKHKYRDELAAKIALAKIRNSAKSGHEEKRYYFCKRCRGWHLTSKPGQKEFTAPDALW